MLLVSACSEMDATDCEFADWKILGIEDGAKGKSNEIFRDKFNECNKYGIKADREKYMLGWNQGIKQFCTTRNGFEYGKKHEYKQTCPKELERQFLKGYKYGNKIREQRMYIGRLESEKYKHEKYVKDYEKRERRGEKPDISLTDYNEAKEKVLYYEKLLKVESKKFIEMKEKYNKEFKI